MTTKWQDKLGQLWEDMQSKILNSVREFGKEDSRDFPSKVIKVPESLMLNVGHDDYIIELGEFEMYTNNGQIYGYGNLTHEELAEITDWVENQN